MTNTNTKIFLQETDDGCMVWEIGGDVRDKIDFFSSLYLARQAYPAAVSEALPPAVTVDEVES